MKKAAVFLIVFFSIVFIIFFTYFGEDLIPIGIKRVFHLLLMPNDLFKPIVNEEFPFWEKGFTKTYHLEPKYSDLYAVSLKTDVKELYVDKYKFKGKLEIEYYKNNDIISRQIISEVRGGVAFSDDYNYYKEIWLTDFPFNVEGKYKNNLSIKVTVIEPDVYLKKLKDSVTLCVAVKGNK